MPSNLSIRNYVPEDAIAIGKFNAYLESAYEHNHDFIPDNIFCATDVNNRIYAVGHLEPFESCAYLDKPGKTSEYVHRYWLGFSKDTDWDDHNQEEESRLIDQLLKRLQAIKRKYGDKHIRACVCFNTDQTQLIQYFIRKRFVHRVSYLRMRRSLQDDLPQLVLPEGFQVRRYTMDTMEDKMKYLAAETAVYGESWSLSHLEWIQAQPGWHTITVFKDEQIVASVMTWDDQENSGMTERIFVQGEWQNLGLAKYVITLMLQHLKNLGKSEALLGVFSDNAKGATLYTALGYELTHIMMQFEIDIVP